jgi:hypothetical protein
MPSGQMAGLTDVTKLIFAIGKRLLSVENPAGSGEFKPNYTRSDVICELPAQF